MKFRLFLNTGSTRSTIVPSIYEYIGSNRTIFTYLPPSYQENPKPEYDVIFMFDLTENERGAKLVQLFDQIFTSNYAQEAVIIGFGDYGIGADRANLLTQVLSNTFFTQWISKALFCL